LEYRYFSQNEKIKKRAIIVICVSRPKSASFSSASEFSGRGVAEGGQKAFFGRGVHEMKDIIGKIKNVFCVYLFQIVAYRENIVFGVKPLLLTI
jgi:hypothetical protein